MNRWLRKAENWGPGAPRRQFSEDHWEKPVRWNKAAAKAGRQLKVFPSVCDPFDNEVPLAWRQRFLSLIARTPHLTWLILTKRIGNARRMLSDASMHDGLLLTANDEYRPPENLWLGATVVNQEEFDRDLPKLDATPAAVRFLSVEPMLGPIIDDGWLWGTGGRNGVDWVICGGESGRGARPMHPDWARSLRDQCAAAGVPFLWKQWGEWLPINQHASEFTDRLYRSRVKAKLHEDQAALDDSYGRTCTVPEGIIHVDGSLHQVTEPMAFLQGTGAMHTFKVGKKAAGRLLDGAQHDGFPGEQRT
jgi:protein gp37